jgi:hypothetical protein
VLICGTSSALINLGVLLSIRTPPLRVGVGLRRYPPLPNLQRRIVARCPRRNDAESHLQVLRQLMPTVPFEIVFDITPDKADE